MKKREHRQDPQAEQEAQRYENPIASREYILTCMEEIKEPVSFEKLTSILEIHTEGEQEALMWRLRAMVRDGQLVCTRSEKYALVDQLDLIRGYVSAHPEGYGYVIPEDSSGDLFLSAKQMRQVFDGDEVLVRVAEFNRRRGKREGAIVRVVRRQYNEVAGRFFIEGGVGFVVPDNKRLTQDILIPSEFQQGAKSGEMVVAEITAYPTLRMQAIGAIKRVLGSHMAPGMETDVALHAHGIPYEWPEVVEQEASRFLDYVPECDTTDRNDLRSLHFVTIDGEDARDFDDAVYCEPRENKGWTLYVAIADVSHYVKWQTALDQHALERGNSTYFPSRVIPMLPEALSNGLCSLNPKVDRLVMVCELHLNAQGEMQSYEFYNAVIHSKARLTYTQVHAMLNEGDTALQQEYSAVYNPYLTNLQKVFYALYARRQAVGAIDFDLAEPYVIFDQQKKIKSLLPRERNEAHRIIEECMLAANIAAAKFLLKQKKLGMYRVHEGPKVEKIEDLITYLSELGLRMTGNEMPTPKDYAQILEKAETRPDKHIIQMLLLRSMMQAHYSAENNGHFGLGFEAYTHFTSPIRRYPDLIVHRLIKAYLANQSIGYSKTQLEEIANHCSMTERRSDEASRDVMSWLKCEFMLDKVGETYEGRISSVTSFGLFIELNGIYVEGLVHISQLANDFYHFDSLRHILKGEASGKVYALGDPVTILVARVDLAQRQIDFNLIEPAQKKKEKRKIKRKK